MKKGLTLAISLGLAIVFGLNTSAEARRYHRHYHHGYAKHYRAQHVRTMSNGTCRFNNDGKTICTGEASVNARHTSYAPRERHYASQSSRVVSGVSPACRPWYGLTCGCEVSLKVFGRVVNAPNLKQARVWGQVFQHTSPGVGMVPGRGGHVALIIGGGPGAWELFDPNSGGRLNRIRTSDLREFAWVVNPHEPRRRLAMR